MSSDRRRTTRSYSANKRARQEKKWVFPVVLLFCVLVLLAGAAGAYYSFTPFKYSEEEVDAYVKNIYGNGWGLLKKSETTGDDGGMDTYVYVKEGVGSFSVFTTAVPVEQDGEYTGRSRKALFDNYFSAVIESKMEEIRKVADRVYKDDGPELEIEQIGESGGTFGARYVFRLYLEDHEQTQAAASLIAQLDNLLEFSCGKGSSPWSGMRAQTPYVRVYLKPDCGITGGADAVTRAAKRGSDPDAAKSIEVPGDWRSPEVLEGYKITDISFTDLSSSSRHSAENLAVRLENDYVDAARTFGKEHYSVSDELMEKYPAPVLTLVNVGGNDLTKKSKIGYSYQFIYHRASGTYWMVGLDPCENFDENPFGNYSRRGAFANLVKWLGGTYMADDWTGTWRIGTTEWEATLQTLKTAGRHYTYNGFRLTRDGNITNLDPVPAIFSGTGAVPSGRPFSIHDLIRMLDVRITINQKEMTAVMFRDFDTE